MIFKASLGCIVVLFCCSAFFARFASGQVAGGTISGTVTDSSGAVISGTTVRVRNTMTDVSRTVSTNDSGFYSVPNLLPGPYQVVFSFTRFKTAVEQVELAVGAEVVTNTQLVVGNSSEKVEVAGEAAQVQLATSDMSGVVNGPTMRELPLNGRDWTLLAALEPGVHTVDTQTPGGIGQNTRGNRGWGTQMTISGARPTQNNYRLDGISINDNTGGAPGSTLGLNLGVEAIQEFSIVTANPSAEYGKTSGGVFNAITRSGTNRLHGPMYEFLRNSALDARNFFDQQTPPFRRNQFGVSAGAPIIKDRTFVFGDFEGLRQNLSTTTLLTVPSTAARSGRLTGGAVTVDQRVAPYVALFPLPNVSETGDTGTASFVQNIGTKRAPADARMRENLRMVPSIRSIRRRFSCALTTRSAPFRLWSGPFPKDLFGSAEMGQALLHLPEKEHGNHHPARGRLRVLVLQRRLAQGPEAPPPKDRRGTGGPLD